MEGEAGFSCPDLTEVSIKLVKITRARSMRVIVHQVWRYVIHSRYHYQRLCLLPLRTQHCCNFARNIALTCWTCSSAWSSSNRPAITRPPSTTWGNIWRRSLPASVARSSSSLSRTVDHLKVEFPGSSGKPVLLLG